MRLRGGLLAHVVMTTAPLITANFRGQRDEGGCEVVGRAVALRRRGVVVPLGALSRMLLLSAVKLCSDDTVRGAYRRMRDAALGAATASVRSRLLGRVKVRALTAEDAPAALRFAGDHLEIDAVFLLNQLQARWTSAPHAFGAFTARGGLVGFGYVDSYRNEGVPLDGEWLRYQFVAPRARHLGIARRLVEAQVEAARARGHTALFADLRTDNDASSKLLRGLGFVTDSALSGRVNTALHAPDGTFEALTLTL